ncbi:slalom [Carabus blaptoides fortunei]
MVEVNTCLLVLLPLVILYFLNKVLINSEMLQDVDKDYVWILSLCMNIFNYSTVLVPGYLVFRYMKSSKYLENADMGYFPSVVRLCLGDNDDEHSQNPLTSSTTAHQRTAFEEAILLIFCFLGLQVSYLSWGVLQEKVMTQEYTNEDGDRSHYKDSQFLVLVNRVLAFCMSGTVLLFTRQPRHKAPLHKYVFCSLSNILSSWCQYEALKYVSFPNQVLAKAGKVIPVMIMSKIVSRTKYEYYEYVTAGILSTGMIFFMLDTGDNKKGSSVTTISGFILLGAYILFDSFTSNWQSELFKKYGMSSVQMMCAVNLFSCVFTAMSLLQQGGFICSIQFMMKFPRFVLDCFLLSACSAVDLKIYNESIVDLLCPKKGGHEIRMTDAKGTDVYVTNLTIQPIDSAEQLKRFMKIAQQNRAVAATENNE